MADIALNTTTNLETDMILSVRKTTNEFVVKRIEEDVENRIVRADIELGPFVTETGPGDRTTTRGASRRGINVWEGAAYDAVELEWDNTMLVARIKEILDAEALVIAEALGESV